ncbi:MAG: hypothetical protein M1838_002787 [Thelocarpon superellum]|nr:MAG: hypothetical protein M1838_002787 [Thelocarpon superellum]
MAQNEDAFNAALLSNSEWASQTASTKPTLFPSLASAQHPTILWIGCADSRVPETTILGLPPGQVFVHRNIANVVHPGDISCASVLEYGIVHLKISHVVLCGHTNCGGAAAALAITTDAAAPAKSLGVLDPWLHPLRALRAQHAAELQKLAPAEAAVRLAELNVLAGVETLKENVAVKNALREGKVTLHGVVYDTASGLLRVLS